MKTRHIFLAFISISFLATAACKKDKTKGCTDPISINYNAAAEENDGSCQYGGLGGNTLIVAKPQHHGEAIINKAGYLDSAFVKFNAQDAPGYNPSDYDLVVVGEVGEDHVHIENLRPGKYFILMAGFDTTIQERVVGGIPYILYQTSGEVDVVIPVTE